MELSEQTKLLVRQQVALCRATVEPHCQGQHPHDSLNLEKSR